MVRYSIVGIRKKFDRDRYLILFAHPQTVQQIRTKWVDVVILNMYSFRFVMYPDVNMLENTFSIAYPELYASFFNMDLLLDTVPEFAYAGLMCIDDDEMHIADVNDNCSHCGIHSSTNLIRFHFDATQTLCCVCMELYQQQISYTPLDPINKDVLGWNLRCLTVNIPPIERSDN